MRVIVRLPESEVELQLSAYPTERDGIETWFIAFPAGEGLSICHADGLWKSLDGNTRGLSDAYIQELGRAIKPADSFISSDDEIDGVI
jgi:hypothetical protein